MTPRRVRSALLSAAAGAARLVGRGVLQVKRVTGLLRPVRATPYTGHGTPQLVHVKGRVRERPGVGQAKRSDSQWDNVADIVRQFTATAVPGATVRLRLTGAEPTGAEPTSTEPTGAGLEVTADPDGYFRARLHPVRPLTAGWHEVTAELVQPRLGDPAPVPGRVLIPPADADFAIISDLDDTVIRSGITNPARAALTLLLNNATTRTPFPGVAAFYRALRAGPSGAASNPLFYVSSSPWNLYDLVVEFLARQDIPEGPLFLRAWGLDADALPVGGHSDHKSELINGLLTTYPHLSFVLIGDSGQQDPEIYRDVVTSRPGRVLAVYIRDVTDTDRHTQVQDVAREVRSSGVPFELVADTAAAARHAAGLGLLSPAGEGDVVAAARTRADHPPTG